MRTEDRIGEALRGSRLYTLDRKLAYEAIATIEQLRRELKALKESVLALKQYDCSFHPELGRTAASGLETRDDDPK